MRDQNWNEFEQSLGRVAQDFLSESVQEIPSSSECVIEFLGRYILGKSKSSREFGCWFRFCGKHLTLHRHNVFDDPVDFVCSASI